jgi:hypothetical protein
MDFVTTYLPFLSSVISFIFAFFVLKRYAQRRKNHLLLWGIGMIFYGIGGFCEGYYGFFGWNDLVFRLWYLFGAILVAAWLGQGTVFLLAKKPWPTITMVLLGLGSIYDPSLVTTSIHTGSELSGHAIVTSGVRSLTPIFNIYGTITLVGGAAWSAWIFFRSRLVCLDIFPQTGFAAPHNWQHFDRGRGIGPRIWRCRQSFRDSRRPVYRRTYRGDPDVHRVLAGNHTHEG